jgi:translation initiation factor IF-3
VKTAEALDKAREAELDLVEIAKDGKPPVAKILDYKKFSYEQAYKSRQSKKNTVQTEIKEIRFRMKTDENDYRIKVNKLRSFLEGGDKVKIGIQFRGRENQHPEYGYDRLQEVKLELEDVSKVENEPTLEGRRMSMVLGPKSKKVSGESEQKKSGRTVKEKRLERQKAQLARKKALEAEGNKGE